MLILLKALFPGFGTRDFIWLAAILAVGAMFSYYTIHERGLGAAERTAKDAKLSAEVDAHNAAEVKLFDLQIANKGKKLDETLAAPVVDAPIVRLCIRPLSDTDKVPGGADGAGPTAGNPETPVVGGGDAGSPAEGPDIGLDIIVIVRRDDAEITYLLGYIDELEALLRNAK